MESYSTIGQDPANPDHVIIVVRAKNYSVIAGTEQSTANEMALNLNAGN